MSDERKEAKKAKPKSSPYALLSSACGHLGIVVKITESGKKMLAGREISAAYSNTVFNCRRKKLAPVIVNDFESSKVIPLPARQDLGLDHTIEWTHKGEKVAVMRRGVPFRLYTYWPLTGDRPVRGSPALLDTGDGWLVLATHEIRPATREEAKALGSKQAVSDYFDREGRRLKEEWGEGGDSTSSHKHKREEKECIDLTNEDPRDPDSIVDALDLLLGMDECHFKRCKKL